jgi:hypothetical protein
MLTRVASIHFAPVHADRSIYGGMYDIPAVAIGAEPYIADIEDKVQKDEGPISTGPGGGRRSQLRYHVDGFDIATDIVAQWATSGLGMTPQAHPGIWVVRDRVAVVKKNEAGKDEYVMDGFNKQVFRSATSEEAKAMWKEDLAANQKADHIYAEWCYMDGNRIAADVRNIQFIPENYKRGARQYGLQAEWLKEGAALMVMPCPRCTKIISKAAIICPQCNEPVDLGRYAAWEAEKAAAIRDAKKGLPVAA